MNIYNNCVIIMSSDGQKFKIKVIYISCHMIDDLVYTQ